MTGGTVIVLGPTGRNFAAGMSGGEAFVLDELGAFEDLCNTEMVGLESIELPEDQQLLKNLLLEHFSQTGSLNAERILNCWEKLLQRFVKIMPRDYKKVLQREYSGGSEDK